MCDLNRLTAAIDGENLEDPHLLDGEPLAAVQGRRASAWLSRLDPYASPELQLAARAHHLRRWEIGRADFADGRAGYLQWRTKNKAHQAAALARLMRAEGWSTESIERVTALLSRINLRHDNETQALEDAACLVFLETQFDDLAERLDHDHVRSVVSKTLRKMSTSAIELAGEIKLSATTQQVLVDALTSLEQDPT